MDENKEQSNSSSFEDLSNENGNETEPSSNDKPTSAETSEPEIIDVIGNGQLTKKVC